MATIFNINHKTTYQYSAPVYDNKNLIKIYPIKSPNQEVLRHEVHVTGNPDIQVAKDAFGNRFGQFTVSASHQELIIESVLVIKMQFSDVVNRVMNMEHRWEDINLLSMDNAFMLFLDQGGKVESPGILNVVNQLNTPGKNPLNLIQDFTSYVYNNFQYNPNTTNAQTSTDQVWNLKSGVCQDFAHVLISMLRSVNIPARYVSGYICPNQDGMRGDGASHAWVEAYLPGFGWLGMDPTNNLIVDDKHVRLATGRDFNDVSPVKGEFKGQAFQNLFVTVTAGYEEEQKYDND